MPFAASAKVAALKGSKAHGDLHELLTIFSTGSLKAFNAFAAAKPAGLWATYALDKAACADSMRLLTLTSLAAEKPEVPYAEVAEALEVPLEAVEEWVVKAIAATLLDAKLDQQAGLLRVSRAAHRKFGPAEWAKLTAKLGTWKGSLAQILATVSAAKQAQVDQAVPPPAALRRQKS